MINLQHMPSLIVRKALKAASVGSLGDSEPNAAWPMYAVNMPSAPDEAIVVRDTAGIGQGRTMVDGEAQLYYGIQVTVRAARSSVGFVKAQEVRRAFELLLNVPVDLDASEYIVENAQNIGPILPLGRDGENSHRYLFTVNCTVSLDNRV